MSIGKTALYTVVSGTAGLMSGMAIDALTDPVIDDNTLIQTTHAAATMLLLNGFVVALASQRLQEDPTGGMVFFWTLIASQPKVMRLVRDLADHGQTAAAATLKTPEAESTE